MPIGRRKDNRSLLMTQTITTVVQRKSKSKLIYFDVYIIHRKNLHTPICEKLIITESQKATDTLNQSKIQANDETKSLCVEFRFLIG